MIAQPTRNDVEAFESIAFVEFNGARRGINHQDFP